MRLVGDLVALHANVAHAGRGHQVEDAIDHSKARAQNGDDGELLAGKLLKRGSGDGSLDFDILHGQVAHGLVAVKKRELAYELAVDLSRRIDNLCWTSGWSTSVTRDAS